MSLTTPDVIAILLLDAILFIFATIALIISIQIVRKWNTNATTPLQYKLEKRSYLVATIIKYIFYLKLPLFLYFIFTLDKLSTILPGAMCAAGVTNATVYGTPLFIVKIMDLYLFGLWIVMHQIDLHKPNYPFTRMKFLFFILIYPIFVVEFILEILHFGAINPHVIVSCCGTLFSAAKTSYVSSFIRMPASVILGIFYGNFLLIVFLYMWYKRSDTMRNISLYALLNLLFVPVSIISLIAFFSTYVYQLPHHHCPFCMLQKDYWYIGYVIYTCLFVGTFFAMAAWMAKWLRDKAAKKWMKISILFDWAYLIIVSLYPLVFYIKNGVWL